MSVDGDIDSAPKPIELLRVYDETAAIFQALKRAFSIGDTHQFSLADIDSAGESLHEVTDKAAFAMRKLQALRCAATPGERTANTVVVTFVADLNVLLASLAERIEHTDREAYGTMIDGLLVLNKAAIAVTSMSEEADVIILI